jgi:hypothetical protein
MRNAAATAADPALLQHDGDRAVSYFNLEFNPQMATSLVHCLNRRYKGAQKFPVTATDAQGTLIVWARDLQECREHLLNALFDLIFARNRVGAAVTNPPCIFCGGKTQSRGRNSSGTRGWRCVNPDCQRSFVLDRSFRGGINHPTQSKKPAFYQLVFVDGKTIRSRRRANGNRTRWLPVQFGSVQSSVFSPVRTPTRARLSPAEPGPCMFVKNSGKTRPQLPSVPF